MTTGFENLPISSFRRNIRNFLTSFETWWKEKL